MDKKLSELISAASIDAADVSLLVHNNTDYQYSFATLLTFLSSNLSTGAAISFGTTLPQNTAGKNGDVFVNTTAGSFAQKIAGTWNVVYTLPSGSNQNDGTVLYGLGVPANATGLNNDTYINTTTGIFYKKTAGAWSPVFTMLNGPAGAKGDKGDKGDTGAAGRTILQGATNPSNSTDGSNGDFYINISTYTLFGPKTAGVWGAGITLIGPQGEKGETGNTGPQGAKGDTGEGVPTGGTAGQVLAKASGEDYVTQWIDQQDISGKADNNNVVHLTGDEYGITGDKSWGGQQFFNGGSSTPSDKIAEFNGRLIARTSVEVVGTEGLGANVNFFDGNIDESGHWRLRYDIDYGKDLVLSKYGFGSGNGSFAFTDNSNIIDGNGKYFLKTGDAASDDDVVHLIGDETIEGTKTFNQIQAQYLTAEHTIAANNFSGDFMNLTGGVQASTSILGGVKLNGGKVEGSGLDLNGIYSFIANNIAGWAFSADGKNCSIRFQPDSFGSIRMVMQSTDDDTFRKILLEGDALDLINAQIIGGDKTFNGSTQFNTHVKINYDPGIAEYQFEADGNSRLGGSVRFENTITMAGGFQVSKDSESMYFSGEGDILFVDEVAPIVPLSDVGYILAAKPHVAGNKLVKINKNSFPNIVTLVPYSGATETLDLNAQWLVGVGVFIAGHVNGSLGHFGANANVRSDEFGVVIGDQSTYNQPADNPMIKNMKGIGFGRETDGFTGYTYIQPYENTEGRSCLALSFQEYVFMGPGVERLRLKYGGALQGGADYSSQVNETTYIQKAFLNPNKLTGTVISFNRENIYGDLDTPITGNISFSPVTDPDAPQDIFGIVCQMIHNDVIEPLYPSAFKKLSGSGDYVPGENNYIFCEYLSDDVILYNIQQAS